LPAEDEEIEKILLDANTDLSQQRVQDLLRRFPIVERKKAKPITKDAEDSSNSDESIKLTIDHSADCEDLKRKCHSCMIYKPDRTHHCSVCNQCVLRMDHHW